VSQAGGAICPVCTVTELTCSVCSGCFEAKACEAIKQDRADLAFAIRMGNLGRAREVLAAIDKRMGWA